MNCPRCGFPVTTVRNSRSSEDPSGAFLVRRLRECQGPDCDHRWNTEERETEALKCLREAQELIAHIVRKCAE